MPRFPERLALLLALAAAACARARAYDQSFPVDIQLTAPLGTRAKIQRPVGVVAGEDTDMYVATVAGQLYNADIKTGRGALLNPGGDDQPFGGLCLDSRGPGTVYATGRDSGAVFAFNRRGELLQKYQIVNPASANGTAFLSGCIQTRFQLIIVDSLNPFLYYLRLADEGPLRGHPPLPNNSHTFQGIRVRLEGEWSQIGTGFNAYGVEWTAKHNETAFVLNSATGEIFTCSIKESGISSVMQRVTVLGKMKVFRGALHMLFDSKNENILYLSMPHFNAIAVLEFSPMNPRRAKFIRMLTSPLIDGPLAIGEYGNWIYPVSGKFSKKPKRGGPTYNIVQVPRHQQRLDSGDPDQEFTTVFDGAVYTPPPIVGDQTEIENELRQSPNPVGTTAPVPITTTAPSTPNPAPSGSPAGSQVPRPIPSNTGTPAPNPPASSSTATAPSSTPSATNGSDTRPTSVFAVEESDSEGEAGSSACFPASGTVRTEHRGVVRMENLRIGDRVSVGQNRNGNEIFSDVFLFSHQDRNVESVFVQIFTAPGQVLELSVGHYLYVNEKLTAAGFVKVGDTLTNARGKPIRVSKVQKVRRQGLYNPQTAHGDIIVNGIKASTYTSAVDPVVACALLSPLRAAFVFGMGVSRRVAALLIRGGNGMERFLPAGNRVCS